MCSIDTLFSNNRHWSRDRLSRDAGFFRRLALQQSPKYLWVGCSDSRVPANEIIGLQPGEVFVHRNVANLVVHSDMNCQSVLQYAVDVLRVEQIIVVGHYGCGGIQAVLDGNMEGMSANWLGHVEDVANKHVALLDATGDAEARSNLLCELNVIEQVFNVCRTSTLKAAWHRRQKIEVHGLIYGLRDGLLRRIVDSASSLQSCDAGYRNAIAGCAAARSRAPTCQH